MSRKITRRRFLEVSALAAVGAVAAGCKPAPTAAPSTVGTQAPVSAPPTAASRPVVELVISRGEHPSQPILQDAPAHIAQGEAVGVKLNFQPVPAADYGAKLQVWMATKQVPDIVRAGFSEIRDYADPSVFRPVLPLIEEYGPNLKKYLSAYPDEVKKLTMGGHLFIIPATSYNTKLLAPMPCIRKDLLDEIGMSVPRDFEELYQALKELKRANPQTLGWTARGGIKRTFMIVAYPFGSGLGGWMRGIDVPYWEPTENKWLYGPIHPEFVDVLDYLARLYKEQLLDPDIAATTPDQWHEKNGSGKGLFTWDNFSFCVRWNKAVRELDPKATWTPIPTVKGSKGARQNDYSGFAGSGGGWCISANCKYPERAIELLDWKLTPVGLDTCSWGIQDVHYSLSGQRPDSIEDYTTAALEKVMDKRQRALKPDVLAEYATKADPFRSFQSDTGTGQLDFGLLWDDAVIYSWDAPGEADAWYEMSSADPGLHPEVMVPSFTKEETARLKQILADVNVIIDPAIEKVVTGQAGLSDFAKAVEDAIKAGARELEDIYNEAEVRG